VAVPGVAGIPQKRKSCRKLFERRQKGDYTDTVAFGRAEVEAWLTETKAFVERINSWLNENVLEKT
jgi:uncharacterized protein (UPF0332 family)